MEFSVKTVIIFRDLVKGWTAKVKVTLCHRLVIILVRNLEYFWSTIKSKLLDYPYRSCCLFPIGSLSCKNQTIVIGCD